MGRFGVALLCVTALLACDPAPSTPVTVYVPVEFEGRANAWLPKSGLAVTVIAGDSAANTERILAKRDSPRADVLVTSGIVDAWYAADNGALRPIAGEAFESVPAALKDPDGMWAALSSRHVAIGTAPGEDVDGSLDLRQLAAPGFSAQVCLSSSVLEDNRALISMLIDEFGNRPAERIVRGWVRNLARPPFATEAELTEALLAGDCRYGIISTATEAAGITRIELPARYYNIQGVGVARHAQDPDAGQQLVDWMLAQVPRQEPPAPAGPNVGQAGWYDEEARLLAERAGYR